MKEELRILLFDDLGLATYDKEGITNYFTEEGQDEVLEKILELLKIENREEKINKLLDV